MQEMLNTALSYVWSPALVFLCLGVGIVFSLSCRLLQVRHLRNMVALVLAHGESSRGLSSFQALAMSVAGRVGTGNIVGVAMAITYGGPGAVFWMWVMALLGAASSFAETSLAQVYREEKQGKLCGGPAFYISSALGFPSLAKVFAISAVLSLGLILPMVQSNSLALGLRNGFGISTEISGIVAAIVLGVIVIGGVKRIGHAAEFLVPLMALLYLAVAAIVIAVHWQKIPEVLGLIISSAFGINPVIAGGLGFAVLHQGIQRGAYSNEAGLGTAPHAAAAAEVSHPAQQGLVQALSVFIDTLVVCSATAFMILITDSYNVIHRPSGMMILENAPNLEIGPAMTQAAVEGVFPFWGAGFVAISLTLFAFTNLLAYSYMAEVNLGFLWRSNPWLGSTLLKLLSLAAVVYGASRSAELAWSLGDLSVGVMGWINIVVILCLLPKVVALLRDYEAKLSSNEPMNFNPKDLGINLASTWPRS